MSHPTSYPALDLQVARASAILLPAGAYDVTPLDLHCPGFDFVTLYVSYTRGAAGGSAIMLVEFNPSSTLAVWYQASLYAAAAVVANADSISRVQREGIVYAATAAALETVVIGPIALNRTVQRMRVRCAELGVVGTPGILAITAHFSALGEER